MKTQIRLLLLAATILTLAVSPLHAQIVADGATNTLSNVTNTFTGSVIIGTNGSFTLLVLSDNALLTNSANGIIGRNSTATSNEVRLISSTSRWRMGGSLFVGSNGVSSRLVVSNGALLEDSVGNIGFRTASGNNSALITGPGSLWTNRGSFTISSGFFASSSNRLVVSNSAALFSGGTATVSGSGNQVVITGVGSRWANQSDFAFGGSGNRLELNGGAGLVSSTASLTDFSSGDDDIVLLTGTGTFWTNNGDLTIGFGGARCLLTASNAASLFIGGRVLLGDNGGANLNSVSITDPGTSWTIGSDLYVGNLSSANLLMISNGGFVVSSNALIGANIGASGNSALVVGAGSVWSNRNDFTIGSDTFGNTLVVSNGATVFAGGSAVLGVNSGANLNSAVVTDAGTRWVRSTRS